nr:hydantoinase/oxoprolinase family protein [Gammaproteobacteria bacterium]
YRDEFGNTLGGIRRIVISLETTVVGAVPGGAEHPPSPLSGRPAKPSTQRPVYFGGWLDTAIYNRNDLHPGAHFSGPAVVEQSDATTVVEPGMHARIDAFGNLLVEEGQ